MLAQIGTTVYGGGWPFLVLQAFTTGILILAANTAFQDFPRLAAILAGDRFLPSQFRNRGDRLVFSNGIILLAVAAAGLVVLFQADVTHLIPLYAIGVFTSFTLSQAGMSVRHIRLKEKGWRLGISVNGLGAVVTGVVTVVAPGSKRNSAWMRCIRSIAPSSPLSRRLVRAEGASTTMTLTSQAPGAMMSRAVVRRTRPAASPDGMTEERRR